MPIGQLLQDIASAWPAYLAKKKTDKNDGVHKLVKSELPNAIREVLGAESHFHIYGSDGSGNVTTTPWVGIFDPALTISATSGYYVVYLYSVDLNSATLCIAFGTTQFEKQFGGYEKAFPRMREAAARLQHIFRDMMPERYSLGPIDLAAGPRNRLHFAYEQSSICSLPPYQLNALPSEEKLKLDLLEIAGIYSAIIEDPLRPEIEELLQSVIPTPAIVEISEVRNFVPRQQAKQRGDKSGGSGKTRRYSPQSRKVGDAGERAVLAYERSKLETCGRVDLIPKIDHHAAKGEFPGWDITSFDENGNKIFIEVKSTIGSSVSSVDITANEWRAATSAAYQGSYYIYLVTHALSVRPTIEKLCSPNEYVSSGKLAIEPLVFQLSLKNLKT